MTDPGAAAETADLAALGVETTLVQAEGTDGRPRVTAGLQVSCALVSLPLEFSQATATTASAAAASKPVAKRLTEDLIYTSTRETRLYLPAGAS